MRCGRFLLATIAWWEWKPSKNLYCQRYLAELIVIIIRRPGTDSWRHYDPFSHVDSMRVYCIDGNKPLCQKISFGFGLFGPIYSRCCISCTRNIFFECCHVTSISSTSMCFHQSLLSRLKKRTWSKLWRKNKTAPVI